MKNRLSGFTLSEALIALTVVGIISALTIPALMQNYQNRSNLIALKKAYIELQQNLTMFKTENYRNRGLYGSRLHLQQGGSVEDTTGYFLKNYYKTNTDCKVDTQPCFASKYGSINGNNDEDFSCGGYSVLLPSGAAICMSPALKSIKHMMGGPGKPGFDLEIKTPVKVYIDINGPDEPNIGGRDMFTFNIYEDYSIDEVPPESLKAATVEADRNNLYNETCLTSSVGEGCFGKILNDNWNMNY